MLVLKTDSILDNYKPIILDVVQNYVEFLKIICNKMLINIDNEEINERKYLQVKKEFFNFLVRHKKFFKLSSFQTMLDDKSIIDSLFINYHEGLDQFMKLEDLLKHTEKIKEVLISKSSADLEISYDIVLNENEIVKEIKNAPQKNISKNKLIKKIKKAFSKQEISKKDIKKFFNNNFLIESDKLNTVCCNYEELQASIKKSANDYINSKVTVEAINEFTIKFRGFADGDVENTYCGICSKFFERHQKVCHLPCNHYYCIKCIECWFKSPENSTEANFRCLFCLDACS